MKLLDIIKNYYFMAKEIEIEKEIYQDMIQTRESIGLMSDNNGVKKYQARINQKQMVLHKTLAYVNSIKDPLTRVLLKERYINRKPWKLVADKLGYSEHSVYQFHKKIMESLEDIEI